MAEDNKEETPDIGDPAMGSSGKAGQAAVAHEMVSDPWDHLAEQILFAFFASVFAYGLAGIRTLIRQGKLGPVEESDTLSAMLTTPIDQTTAVAFYKKHREALKKHKFDSTVYYQALEDFMKEEGSEKTQQRRASLHKDPITIVVFDDENSDKELVYGITVNTERQVLAVSFRGSVTIKDWEADLKEYITQEDNPLLRQERSYTIPQDKIVGIHSGFYDYLLAPVAGSNKSKYDQILEHLYKLSETYPHYKLGVCGHSLGGALATLFTFQLAATSDDRISKPITCISFASPKVGNVSFSRAFHELELQGKVRNLRVTNHKDKIPKLPVTMSIMALCSSGTVYRHVGMNLCLFHDRSAKTSSLRFPRVFRSRFRNSLYSLRLAVAGTPDYIGTVGLSPLRAKEFLKRHSCMEYLVRIERADPELKKKTVDQLYTNYGDILKEEINE